MCDGIMAGSYPIKECTLLEGYSTAWRGKCEGKPDGNGIWRVTWLCATSLRLLGCNWVLTEPHQEIPQRKLEIIDNQFPEPR